MSNEFKLPEKLLLGVATASSQIEGGFTDSNWNDWYEKGKIKDGSNPERANDHYRRFKDDINLMAEMNIEIYRMSIEWSRIQPKQGYFDEEVIAHYREEITCLQSKGIKVLLTLHHFNNPMWFERLGGFLNNKSSDIFLEFVSHIVLRLGDIVSEYVTINEPNVYVTSAYYFGEFPPGHKSFNECREVFTNLALSHIKAYKAIHEIRVKMGFKDTKVGYASHVRIFEPYRKKNLSDKLATKLMDKLFQVGIDDVCMLGKVSFPIKNNKYFKEGKYYDFIGINYYARSMVKMFEEFPKKDAPHNDMGWEIYPEGIGKVAKRYFEKYNTEIYITENGTADKEDKFRSKFIYDHLKVITDCNAPITRYYHWTFIDNFEWIDGESCCFGLVQLDYETQKRIIRKSGNFYTDIIKNKGVTEQMYSKYVK